MISLENDTLKVEINTHGAELCAIYHKETQLEYLWNGNPTYWKRHAPVLFPIVGKLKENQCVIDGKTYETTTDANGFFALVIPRNKKIENSNVRELEKRKVRRKHLELKKTTLPNRTILIGSF